VRRDLGQTQATLAAYREALRIRQDLVARASENRSFQSRLPPTHGYIGDFERESGSASTRADPATSHRRSTCAPG
jgi:hypothetical protein